MKVFNKYLIVTTITIFTAATSLNSQPVKGQVSCPTIDCANYGGQGFIPDIDDPCPDDGITTVLVGNCCCYILANTGTGATGAGVIPAGSATLPAGVNSRPNIPAPVIPQGATGGTATGTGARPVRAN